MKKRIQESFIILIIVLSVNIKAQTKVDITFVNDSAGPGKSYCPTPVLVSMHVSGKASGYNTSTDSIDIHYFWDDGTDTIYKAAIYAPDDFSASVTHSFSSAGVYNIKVIATGPDGKSETVIHTPTIITTTCQLVDGYSYFDKNNNCLFDAGDDTLAGVGFVINDLSGQFIALAYTNGNGYYSASLPSGLTGLQISPSKWNGTFVKIKCPASGSYTFNSTGSNRFNFGFDCTTSNQDLSVAFSSTKVSAPGSEGNISFYANNQSCDPKPSTIKLTLNPNVTYVNMISGQAPSSVTGNVLTWNVTIPPSLQGIWNFEANLNILTNTNAILFDNACFTVSITPTDANPGNNTASICRIIGGPYDPNNKEVIPAGTGTSGNVAPGTEFTYTINFQNTGTAPAINVKVMDAISNNLDMSSFHVIASSHKMNPYFLEGNTIRFDYPNIMLPDSNTNEPLSHGWVVYKIKTKNNLVNGTQIKNTGHIFFDYNSAIITNTTLNTIDISMGITETDGNIIQTIVYPNPAKDQLTIAFREPVTGILSVIDMTGRAVKTLIVNKTQQVKINLQDLSPGLYGLIMPGVHLQQTKVQIIK